MTKSCILRAPDTIASLQRAVKDAGDAAHKTRIRAIIRLARGFSLSAVAREFVVDWKTMRRWAHLYRDGGTDALKLGKGGRPGGNPVWEDAIFDALANEIDKGGYWSLPRMMRWLKEHQHKEVPEQTVWYRMNKLGYSYKSARPHPVQGDREKQETFKKGASRRSWSR